MNSSLSSITERYCELTPGSADLARSARELFPSGVTHDSRYQEPYGIYVERAEGALKWDVDGNQYIDYFGGHGALLLGHAHPVVTQAVKSAADNSTHFAANHPVEVRWAQLVKQLVPSAERVRFTSSGTEANSMAIRLARAHTGRHKILRFRGHFHGWFDEFTSGFQNHFDGSAPVGVSPSVAANVVLCDAGSLDQVVQAFAANPDIAAVMLEPLGAATGMVPVSTKFLEGLRELTAANGALLIFDEVVTGFRITRGGVQAASGVTPDLTTLAKILAGGLPGGAVTGRAELLEWLDFESSTSKDREKIYHPGTYNANPLSASAGAAALNVIATTDVNERTARLGQQLREALTEVLDQLQVPWGVYGEHSVVLLFLNPKRRPLRPSDFDASKIDAAELKSKPPVLMEKLKLAMLINGVDLAGAPGALVSGAHDESHISRTADALRESLLMLRHDGLL
jgi:glutamate-1-semialdehyde 2,1-aminomutase